MKYLWLIRHAKSSWEDPLLSDHDRPLNKRGHRDAPIMAAKVAVHTHRPAYLVSSSAVRALTTASTFHEILQLPEDALSVESRLYHAHEDTVLDVIQEQLDGLSSIALFGHNPTWTYMVERFTGAGIDNVPTCGCALVQSSAERWLDFEQGDIQLVAFLYPKMYA